MLSKKPKNKKQKRILKEREPKVNENVKKVMFIRGHKTNSVVTEVMKELRMMKAPHVVILNKKNEILPFVDASSIEFLSNKNDASLFVLGNHTKKRPNNLVFGRLFDYQILDMFELGADNFQSMQSFAGDKFRSGSKPCMMFEGSEWATNEVLMRLRNFFIDFFRGTVVDRVSLQALDHVLVFTLAPSASHTDSSNSVIYLRNYSVSFKKSGTKIPRVELNLAGPCIDFVQRRSRIAPSALFKEACMQPSVLLPKKRKNVETNVFGESVGTVHMPRQDLSTLAMSKKLRKAAASDEPRERPKKKAKRK